MKSVIKIFSSLALTTTLFCQTFVADGQFNQFVTYYLTSVDLETGETDFQLFHYTLSCPDCPTDATGRYITPIEVSIDFSIYIQSPALGLDDEIAHLATREPFLMYAPVNLDNRDFTIDALEIRDIYGDEISISIDNEEAKDADELQLIFQDILTFGQLPDGIYSFILDITRVGTTDSTGQWIPYDVTCADNCKTILNVVTPVSLELVIGSPGGPWGDLENNAVYTTYPVFNWESDLLPLPVLENCFECGFYIRVAEFRAEDHTSIDDAIEDLTTLPVDQTLGWHYVGNQLDIMYPPTGAIELYPGGIYAYQVQKRVSTTTGLEELESPVYVFSIFNAESGSNSFNEYLKTIITEDVFDGLFDPGGPLSGYNATGNVTLDDEIIEETELIQLKDQFEEGTLSVINLEAE